MKRLICFFAILLFLAGIVYATVDTLEGEELTDAANIEGVTTTDTVEGQVLKAGGGGITYASVQTGTGGTPNFTITGNSYSSGDLVVVVVLWEDSGTISGVEDDAGTPNTFTGIQDCDPGALDLPVYIWWDVITTADADATITLTCSGGCAAASGTAIVFSGSFPGSPVDEDICNDGNSATPTIITDGTLAQAVEVIVVGYRTDSADVTPDGTFNEVYDAVGHNVQYKIVSSTAQVTNTSSMTSGYWTGGLASFKNQ